MCSATTWRTFSLPGVLGVLLIFLWGVVMAAPAWEALVVAESVSTGTNPAEGAPGENVETVFHENLLQPKRRTAINKFPALHLANVRPFKKPGLTGFWHQNRCIPLVGFHTFLYRLSVF